MTTSWSYTQETTQTKTTTRTDNFKVTIPAYTKYTVTTYINQYSMNIKYVATLRATNGKEFKVKGTWSGTSCYEMFQKVKEEKTGKHLLFTVKTLINIKLKRRMQYLSQFFI